MHRAARRALGAMIPWPYHHYWNENSMYITNNGPNVLFRVSHRTRGDTTGQTCMVPSPGSAEGAIIRPPPLYLPLPTPKTVSCSTARVSPPPRTNSQGELRHPRNATSVATLYAADATDRWMVRSRSVYPLVVAVLFAADTRAGQPAGT
jgi:hypothetical protein